MCMVTYLTYYDMIRLGRLSGRAGDTEWVTNGNDGRKKG